VPEEEVPTPTYADLAEIRSIDKLDDVDFFPDYVVESALRQADELIDRYTGTSFTHKPFTATLTGNNTRTLLLPVIFPRSLTSVSYLGDELAEADYSSWALFDDGRVVRSAGLFRYLVPGQNIVIAGTAGATDVPPEAIVWCARVIATNILIQRESRIPDRSTAIQHEFGQVLIAQAGGRPDRPTEFPGVNSVLNQWRDRPPTAW
jgi:hypothetical protein